MRQSSRIIPAGCRLGLLLGVVLPGNVWSDTLTEIGYTQLQSELGAATPTGSGVVVSMAEAPAGDAYRPNPADPELTSKTFVDGSLTNVGNNVHATGVARRFFGSTSSMSPDVDATIVYYDANDWLNRVSGLNTASEPQPQTFDVQNHSWIANAPDAEHPIVENVAQRFDHVVNRDDVLIVAGTNNNTVALPDLMAHSYNSIIVGRSDGNHASGRTGYYGAGRQRPDLVAPETATSWATPVVSSAAAMLKEIAAGTSADHVEVMRSALMAGATKEEFASWDRTSTRPIDDVFGAGELNVYNSYHILNAGETDGSIVAPTTAVGLYGYDFVEQTDFTSPLNYLIDFGNDRLIEQLSISLNWNINVRDADPSVDGFSPAAVDLTPGGDLANYDLMLFDSDMAVVDLSVSTVDNLEHLYLTDLAPGAYTLQVSGASAADYGVADFGLSWRASITAVPEPSMIAMLCGSLLFLIRKLNRRQAIRPGRQSNPQARTLPTSISANSSICLTRVCQRSKVMDPISLSSPLGLDNAANCLPPKSRASGVMPCEFAFRIAALAAVPSLK